MSDAMSSSLIKLYVELKLRVGPSTAAGTRRVAIGTANCTSQLGQPVRATRAERCARGSQDRNV